YGAEGHVVLAEIVGQVELGRGARLHADGRAAQLPGRLHAELLVHDEALAVIEVDARLAQAERHVAHQRLGRVAGQHVDLARLQGDEALLRGGRRVPDPGGIAEDGGGNAAAEVDVDAAPVALLVRRAEA